MIQSRAVHIRFSQWVEWTGYTHKQAAEAIGCSEAAISLLRHGKRSAYPPLAVAIQKATGRRCGRRGRWPDGPIDSREWRIEWHDELVGAHIFSADEACELDALVAAAMRKKERPLHRTLRRKTQAIKRRACA